jgi:fructose-bisphosphate aldolase class II
MGPITMTELFEKHVSNGAICGFNVFNLEQVKAVIDGAEAMNSPVILMVTQGAAQYAGIEYIGAICTVAAQKSSVPVVLHLDHSTDYTVIVKAINNGFTSVMIDGSALPFEENVAITKDVVKVAHAVGISVEAELGRVGGKEDNITVKAGDEGMTDPDEAVRFVNETKVDTLAIAIGTVHGLYKGTPKLNFELLRKIKSMLAIPIVLHGGSDLSDETVREAIRSGIKKFNVGTDLMIAQTKAMKQFMDANPSVYDSRKILSPSMKAIAAVVKHKINITK